MSVMASWSCATTANICATTRPASISASRSKQNARADLSGDSNCYARAFMLHLKLGTGNISDQARSAASLAWCAVFSATCG